MNAHELARELLAGPDLPVVIPDSEHGYEDATGTYAGEQSAFARIDGTTGVVDRQVVSFHVEPLWPPL